MSASSTVPGKDYEIIGINAQLSQDTPEYTLNLYAEKDGDQLTLKPAPGSVPEFQLTPNGGGRGLNNDTGRTFGVRGAFFQEIVNGVPVTKGTLLTVQNPVAIITCLPPNGEGQVLVVDDIAGYVYKFVDNSFTKLAPESGFVGGGSQAIWCASRAFVFKPGTQQFQCSGQYDFTTWDGTAFATVTSAETPIISMASNGALAYFFCSDTFEAWENMGYAVQPLGRVIFGDKIGCLAPNSVFVMKRHVYWLGNNSEGNGEFYRHVAGGIPESITDSPTQRILARTANMAQCITYGYQSLGHNFIVNTFIDGNLTLAYDSDTGLFAERAWRDANTNALKCVPYIEVIFQSGMLLGLSYIDGVIYRIDNDTFTDSGHPIIRQRITQVIPDEGDWQTFFQSVELFGQVGNTPTGSADPQLVMQYSIDRGKTWSQEEWQQVGGNSSYAARTKWTGLGSGFGMCFKFTISCNQYISWRKFKVRAQ